MQNLNLYDPELFHFFVLVFFRLFLLSFIFTLWLDGTVISVIWQVLFFLPFLFLFTILRLQVFLDIQDSSNYSNWFWFFWFLVFLILFSRLLEIVPSAPTTTGITIIIMSHNFLSSLARSEYLLIFSLSFIFTLWSTGTTKFTRRQVSFSCWLELGLVFWPGFGDSLASQNPREFRAFHSLERILICAYNIGYYGQTSISCTIPNG